MITNQIENSRVLGKSSIDNKHNNKRGRNRKYEREYKYRNIAQNRITEKNLFFQKQNTMNLTKTEEKEEKEVKGGNSSSVTVSILHS